MEFNADETVARAYSRYYYLVDKGKKGEAIDCLATLQKLPQFRGECCCPRCGALLLKSDMPGKDLVCLPCEKYYMRKNLKSIDDMVEEFLSLYGNDLYGNEKIYGDHMSPF